MGERKFKKGKKKPRNQDQEVGEAKARQCKTIQVITETVFAGLK